MKKYKELLKSFIYAFSGVIYTINNERNMRIHLTCVVYMFSFLLFTPWFVLTRVEFAVLLAVSALVLCLEVVNTAIENTVNLFTKELNPYAKIAKDAAAGAVLIAAIFAIIIGFVLLFQPQAFSQMYQYFSQNPIILCVTILSTIPATLFIFFGFKIKNNERKLK